MVLEAVVVAAAAAAAAALLRKRVRLLPARPYGTASIFLALALTHFSLPSTPTAEALRYICGLCSKEQTKSSVDVVRCEAAGCGYRILYKVRVERRACVQRLFRPPRPAPLSTAPPHLLRAPPPRHTHNFFFLAPSPPLHFSRAVIQFEAR